MVYNAVSNMQWYVLIQCVICDIMSNVIFVIDIMLELVPLIEGEPV